MLLLSINFHQAIVGNLTYKCNFQTIFRQYCYTLTTIGSLSLVVNPVNLVSHVRQVRE
jgi:hypothetical protein